MKIALNQKKIDHIRQIVFSKFPANDDTHKMWRHCITAIDKALLRENKQTIHLLKLHDYYLYNYVNQY